MQYILTFDFGTTSVKTCLFDEQLSQVMMANEEYSLDTRPGNIVELDPQRYWVAVKNGVSRVVINNEIRTGIVSICICTQGETLIPVDSYGNALRPAIVWLDARAEEEGAFISTLPEAKSVYKRTGVANIDGMTPISKLLWIKRNEPQIYDATYRFLLLEDYIISRLTGLFVSEKVLMSTTAYYDIRQDEYMYDLLAAIGIDSAKLPEVLDSGSVAGKLASEIASELGLSDSVSVVTGAMDQVSAAIGGGNIRKGVVTETTGTIMALMTSFDASCFENNIGINIYRHVLPGMYYIISFCITAGVVLKWFKDEFCDNERMIAQQSGENVYDILGRLAASCSLGADGLIVLPYFDGML